MVTSVQCHIVSREEERLESTFTADKVSRGRGKYTVDKVKWRDRNIPEQRAAPSETHATSSCVDIDYVVDKIDGHSGSQIDRLQTVRWYGLGPEDDWVDPAHRICKHFIVR